MGFGIGLYYLKVPGSDPVRAAGTLAADKRFALTVVDKLDMTARSQRLLSIAYSSKVAEDYAPPSLRQLRYFGRGLSLEQAEALQKAPRVLALGFAHPAGQSTACLRNAEEFVFELAQQENAIIWDVETREAFTPEAWQRSRLKTWDGGTPDVAEQMAIHAYDAVLRAASARARVKLPGLQKAFRRGLMPGEQLLVKAPFSTRDGGREWMWIEVTEWNGDQIKGMLRSDPRDVPGLSAGQMVDSRQSEVFDYLRVFPDGRTEGNETSKLLK